MDGFINILKPSGYTSSDIVVKVRKELSRVLGEKIKVGHLGTLDPEGTGVLPIAIGKATKLFDYLVYKQKTYLAGICLGKLTDTLDSYGKIILQNDKVLQISDVCRVIPKFLGEIEQVPPQYSALKIGGQKAYDLARNGEKIEIKPRKVHIYELEATDNAKPNFFDIKVTCSGGTYIRSLVRDIAKSLDTVGYMSYIIRTKSGSFCIENSVTLDEFFANPTNYIMSIDSVISPLYPKFELPPRFEKLALNGVRVAINNMPKGTFILTIHGKIIGMAQNIDNKLVINNRL